MSTPLLLSATLAGRTWRAFEKREPTRSRRPTTATGPQAPRQPRWSSTNGAGGDRTAFEWALLRAKIQDFRFHDLRHTFASHAVMRGVSLAELKELLGVPP